MGLLEELGLLKMDFLGLRTLTVIRDAIELIRKNHGAEINLDTLSMDDAGVYKLIGDGRTAGVFQLESAGMTQFMKELQPTSLEDIIAGISLYRPGPMDQIPRYIKNKNNPGEVRYEHPLLEGILNVTYGCMVYQEQVMQIVRELGGYSYGRSDLVRRAMSKKKHEVMQKERESFINGIVDENGTIVVEGAVRRGVDARTADRIFDEMMDFASYAFNKSHAAAYAVIAYQTAYLKHYYPVEFMAASLNSFMGSSDKISQYVMDCRAMGIEVLPPYINESEAGFSVKGGRIRFGLAAVKNVGQNAVLSLIREKNENGRYKSFVDFCERIDSREINKRCIESMIKSGAFDSMGIFRSRLTAVYDKMLDGIQQSKKRNLEGQLSLFEMGGKEKPLKEVFDVYPEIPEYAGKMLLAMEKEMLGLYISGHPLKEFENEIREQVTLFSSDLSDSHPDMGETGGADAAGGNGISSGRQLQDGQLVTVAGIITEKKSKTTKSNNLMAFITLEDLFGTMEVIVFPTILRKFASMLVEENIVVVRGKVSIKEEEQGKIICEEVRRLTKNQSQLTDQEVREVKEVTKKTDQTPSRLHIRLSNRNESITKPLHSLLAFFNGPVPVYVYDTQEGPGKLLEREYWVHPDDALIRELIRRFGEENIRLITR
jgi:DNA polymerase-3 subunit alpha